MNQESLKKIQSQIDKVLSNIGISPDKAVELRDVLIKLQKERDRKLLASEIAAELSGKLKPLFNQEKVVEAIKKIKIEPRITVKPAEVNLPTPKVIVNPPKVEIKAQETRPKEIRISGISNLIKAISLLLKGKKVEIDNVTRKKPMPVVLVHKGEDYRAQIVGGGGPSRIWLKNKSNRVVNPALDGGYTQVIGYATGTPIYIGEAVEGTVKSVASWRIKKLTWDTDGNVTDVQWADGNGNFDNIWNDRATYSYS